MASATLGTGAGAYTITAGNSLTFADSGRFLSKVVVGGTRQEVEEFSANGVSGYGTKRHGAREARYLLTISIVKTTETGCITGLVDMVDDLASSGTIQCVVADITFIGRVLADEAAIVQPRAAGTGMYHAETTVAIRKLRSS
jgi:hypothetical protein